MTTTMIREVALVYSGKPKKATLSDPSSVVTLLRKIVPDNVREHLLAIYLDGTHTPIAYYIVATGNANACPVHPREVFQPAILAGATALIVAHNHPSGSVEASPEDRDMTRRLIEAGKLLGVPLLDHVIFTESEHYSFRDRSCLFD